MGERENQFSDDPVAPDGVRDGRHLEIRRQLRHHTPVEITDPLTSLAASKRWDKEEVGVLGHRRERRIEVEVMELCLAMCVARLHHSSLRRCEVTWDHNILLGWGLIKIGVVMCVSLCSSTTGYSGCT